MSVRSNRAESPPLANALETTRGGSWDASEKGPKSNTPGDVDPVRTKEIDFRSLASGRVAQGSACGWPTGRRLPETGLPETRQ
jgi:hypothetical protein